MLYIGSESLQGCLWLFHQASLGGDKRVGPCHAGMGKAHQCGSFHTASPHLAGLWIGGKANVCFLPGC